MSVDQATLQLIELDLAIMERAYEDRELLGVKREHGLVAPMPAPTFRGAALEIQTYRGPEWLLSGPAETGKTWAALWLLDELMRKTPGAQAVLTRQLQNSIYGTVLLTYKKIQAMREAMGQKAATAYGGEKPEFYTYNNDARIWVGGMDNPNKILSGERDFIYVNQAEELTMNAWEILTTRNTGRGAVTDTPMLFGDCNPGAEDHWILKRDGLVLFHSKHQDNPSLYDDNGELTAQGERSISRLRMLTGIRKSRLFLGLWVGAEGLFFDEWDPDLHTCEPFEIPEDWPMWGAFDFGYAHNTAFGIFTEDNDGNIYLVAEHLRNKWLPPNHCVAIRRLMERLKIPFKRLKKIVAGHDVFRQQGDANAQTIATQYAKAKHPESGDAIGLTFVKANIARVPGASELRNRLGSVELKIKPRLKLFNTCTRTIGVMTRMVTDKTDPEDVLKVDADEHGDGGDDAYDMLRYGVMNATRRAWDWS